MTTAAPPPEFLAAAEILASRAPSSKWLQEARRDQVPPPEPWNVWLLMGGRGAGKTRAGSEWLCQEARLRPGTFACVGPSEAATRDVCIEGESGVLRALDLKVGSREYARGTGRITLQNGSTIISLSAEAPERARGFNLSGCWMDELGSWRFPDVMWHECLAPALRIGAAKAVATTTPHNCKLLHDWVSDDSGSIVRTKATTYDNTANLSATAVSELHRRYSGTRLGQRELMGELLSTVAGACWSLDMLDACRVKAVDHKQLQRIIVSVDPAATSGAKSDETGIIVAGLDREGVAFVLDDASCKLPPDGWAQRVVQTYRKWQADRVIVERNMGGEMVESVLRGAEPNLPISTVVATRGKIVRIEPVVANYERNVVRHVGSFAGLEDQQLTWVPGQGASPDRIDALCWAITSLDPGSRKGAYAPFFSAEPEESRWSVLAPGQGLHGA